VVFFELLFYVHLICNWFSVQIVTSCWFILVSILAVFSVKTFCVWWRACLETSQCL